MNTQAIQVEAVRFTKGLVIAALFGGATFTVLNVVHGNHMFSWVHDWGFVGVWGLLSIAIAFAIRRVWK